MKDVYFIENDLVIGDPDFNLETLLFLKILGDRLRLGLSRKYGSKRVSVIIPMTFGLFSYVFGMFRQKWKYLSPCSPRVSPKIRIRLSESEANALLGAEDKGNRASSRWKFYTFKDASYNVISWHDEMGTEWIDAFEVKFRIYHERCEVKARSNSFRTDNAQRGNELARFCSFYKERNNETK